MALFINLYRQITFIPRAISSQMSIRPGVLCFIISNLVFNASARELRDNEINFAYGESVSKVEFDYITSDVSAGQPHDGKFRVNREYIKDYKDTKYTTRTLDFRSGRHASKHIAAEFVDWIGGFWHMDTTGNDSELPALPKSLNFIISTRMFINGEYVADGYGNLDVVYLGQGYTTDVNGWYIGARTARLSYLPHGDTGLIVKTVVGNCYAIYGQDYNLAGKLWGKTFFISALKCY